ncbi:E3 ubiquitin-protein ligase SIAH1-like [Rhinopithecus roxellana]|uniref:E3 ubiquitin-protein ligase SIAH1-like n=1 Tax=Rhinopithecus roxellana TaxID=61622 RepID=UPI00123747E7|nr:E3 ubiquitin-protein ligase SIAH1-like [Rhinopithecus roxellana]
MSEQTAALDTSSTPGKAPAQSDTTRSSIDLAILFQCPVCLDYALPPILQCPRGHLVCSSCHSKLISCPICRGPLGFIRNLAMEKVADFVLFPCRYACLGCEITLPHTEKADHEEVCKFRLYSCPCPGTLCKWQGTMDAVMPHLTNMHKGITTVEGEDIIFLATNINLDGAFDWVMMQSCYGFHFMLVLQKQQDLNGDQQFFATVKLMGTRKEAEKFTYRFELKGHRRRLTWEATPLPIHEDIAKTIKNRDCLIFGANTALHFAENGDLSINATINKC